VEAVGGVVLLISTAAALLWANSAAGPGYAAFWNTPISIAFGRIELFEPLRFWINDGLMTIFFLVVGLEIRREMHEGALADARAAALPIAAALGGIAIPALIYLAAVGSSQLRQGWAIPTATDIAFAVGVLALLGRSIPTAVRTLLLAIAVIDDILAVLIIAAFYSHDLQVAGFAIAAAGVALVLIFQRIGVRSAALYVLPGAVLWFGLLRAGVHPTLTGVLLGLMTPPRSRRVREQEVDTAASALTSLDEHARAPHGDVRNLVTSLRQLKGAQRELLPPVVRVQLALHPWVAYGVMPLFALANAGVFLGDVNLSNSATLHVAAGVAAALLFGKPLGIVGVSLLVVGLRWCKLPANVNWRSLALVGCLGGIGFTMAIFIATLAFSDPDLLAGAKVGVIAGSATAACIGLLFGWLAIHRSIPDGAVRGADHSESAAGQQ
jgi:NhaA family Na+:H+ antiporter